MSLAWFVVGLTNFCAFFGQSDWFFFSKIFTWSEYWNTMITVSNRLFARSVIAAMPPVLLPLLLLFLRTATTAIAVTDDLLPADEDLMKASPLTVAQCRAGCLHKVSFKIGSVRETFQKKLPSLYENCWNSNHISIKIEIDKILNYNSQNWANGIR